MDLVKGRKITSIIINGIFLIILNIILISIIGYLTLDSNANTNSRFGGYLISILIPILIVLITPKMEGLERMLKFGTGFIYYLISSFFILRMPDLLLSGLGPCL